MKPVGGGGGGGSALEVLRMQEARWDSDSDWSPSPQTKH